MVVNVNREMQDLIVEARRLAEIVNWDRFDGIVSESEHTVRLCELMDIIQDKLTIWKCLEN
jgi:hypothetical protein